MANSIYLKNNSFNETQFNMLGIFSVAIKTSSYIAKYNIFILKWFKKSCKRNSTFSEKLNFTVENMKPMKPKFCGSWKVSGYNKKVNEERQLKLCHIKQGVRNSDNSYRCRVAFLGMKHHINDMEILKCSSRARSCLW